MNNVWKLTGFETNAITQHKFIFLIDKLAESFNYKSIIVGYDNRMKSEKVAKIVGKGLANKYNLRVTEKAVTAPMLTVLVKDKIYDMAVYITGDYENWDTYGFKIKLDNGRGLSFKDSKKIKEIMDQYSFKEYKVNWCDDVKTINYDYYYIEDIKRKSGLMDNLDQNITFNALHYCRTDIVMKLLSRFGCKVFPFNCSSVQNLSPNPYLMKNTEETYHFMKLSNNDLAITTTDGETLCIQTPKRVLSSEDIAVMLAEINLKENKLRNLVIPDNYYYLKEFAKQNKIRKISFEQTQYVYNLQQALIVSTTNCIIDTNFSSSMDSLYITLKILDYLKKNEMSLDDFHEKLTEKYKLIELSEIINVNEKQISVNDAFDNLQNYFEKSITKSSKNKIIIENKKYEVAISKKNQSILVSVVFSVDYDASYLINIINENYSKRVADKELVG